MADNRHEGVPALRPLPRLMDGLHGPPLTCVCTVICSAKGGCSSCRQLGKAHLLGLRQPELPASQEERGEVTREVGQETHRDGNQEPHDSSSPGPGLAQREALNSGHQELLPCLVAPWMCCVTVGLSLSLSGL